MGPFVYCQIRTNICSFLFNNSEYFFKMKKSSILLFSVSCFIISKFSMTRFLLVKVDKKENSGDQGDVDAEIQNLANSPVRSRFPPPCFHGSNQIRLENGDQKMISEVKIGDSVLAVDEKGMLKFSPVIMHLDGSLTKAAAFVTIRTKRGRNLTLTPQHLMYKSEKDNAKIDLNEFRTVFAEDIRKGDIVLVLDDGNDMKKDEVVSTDLESRIGYFSPLTLHGNIIVNDILASCYAYEDHSLQHLAFAPFRWYHTVKQALLSEKMMKNVGVQSHGSILTGKQLHWYADALFRFAINLTPEKIF